MEVGGQRIPTRTLTNIDLLHYARSLKIPHFKGVYMRDQLNKPLHSRECGIMNFNKSTQSGTHWVCWVKRKRTRIYFDSFGQHVPRELTKYLKTEKEFKKRIPCIRRNVVIVQHINTSECGGLCLYVLYSLMCKHLPYEKVITQLQKRYNAT